MFGPKRPESPVDAAMRQWIDERWVWLIEQFGVRQVQNACVVLPTPEFFPDAFDHTYESVRKMLDRVCGYMGIAPEAIELSFYQDEGPISHEAPWRGTAGLYLEDAGTHHVAIEVGSLDDPMALVATLAHELGHVLLLGQRRISPDAEDHEPLTDLLTVFNGLGIFTANSVIREQNSDLGTHLSWQIRRLGYLSMDAYGYAFAKFASVRGEDQPTWVKHLRPDVRNAYWKGARYIAAGASESEMQRERDGSDETVSADLTDNATAVNSESEALIGPSLTAKQLLAQFDEGERNFQRHELRGLQLYEAYLAEGDFSGADLRDCNLTGAILTGANFSHADLQSSFLCDADLQDVDLSEADLSGADLTDADLSRADIRGTDFSGAILDRCSFSDVLRDQMTQLDTVNRDSVPGDEDSDDDDMADDLITDRFLRSVDIGSQAITRLLFFGFVGVIGGFLGSGLGLGFFGMTRIRPNKLIMAACAAVGVIACIALLGWIQRRSQLQERQQFDRHAHRPSQEP